MRQVVWRWPQQVVVDQVPDPVIEAGTDAVVQVSAAVIGSQDLTVYGQSDGWMKSGTRLGREAVGTVTEVGPDVHLHRPGDRVVLCASYPCGRCGHCRQGQPDCCERPAGAYRDFTTTGAHADHVRVAMADHALIGIGPELPDPTAVLLSHTLPSALRAIDEAQLPQRALVAVIGLGPDGMIAARMAINAGHDVITVDHRPNARHRAQVAGITAIALDADTPAHLLELQRGRRPDATIETLGGSSIDPPSVRVLRPDARTRSNYRTEHTDGMLGTYVAIDITRPGGVVVLAAAYFSDVDVLPLRSMAEKGLRMSLCCTPQRDWRSRCLNHLNSGTWPASLAELSTQRLPLADASTGYARLYNDDLEIDQVLLVP